MEPVALAEVAAGVGGVEALAFQGAAQAGGVDGVRGQGDGGDGADAFVRGGDQGEAEGEELLSDPAAVGVDAGEELVALAGDAGVEGGEEVGGEGEGYGVVIVGGAVEAQVQVSGQAGVGFGALVAEYQAEAGVGGQSLAAGAAGEPDAAQVDGGGGDAADAVQGQAGVVAAAEFLEAGQVGEGAGGGFAVHRPEPGAGGLGGQGAVDAFVVQGGAPGVGNGGVGEGHPVGVVAESFAEFAGGYDYAGAVEAAQLGGDYIVGEGAGADHNGAVGGAGEAAEAAADALHQAGEFRGAVGEGGLAEGLHHGVGHRDGAGGEDDRLGGGGGDGVVEAAGEFGADVAHRAVHRLVRGIIVAHLGAEGDEADVAVEGLLGDAAGHYHIVVAGIAAVARHHREQAGEDAGAAHIGAHGQEADFAEAGALRLGEVGFQAAEFFVQGEGAAVADADHTEEFGAAAADVVDVFVVEPVHQEAGVVGGVLGDFLDEGGVVEAVDVLELPVLVGLFEGEAVAVAGGDGAGAGVGGGAGRGGGTVGRRQAGRHRVGGGRRRRCGGGGMSRQFRHHHRRHRHQQRRRSVWGCRQVGWRAGAGSAPAGQGGQGGQQGQWEWARVIIPALGRGMTRHPGVVLP